ncbi:MAG: hypothetical protein HYU63_06730 [Armatimonadetes bacterium]|nr:hypothetical protein [Armatimonadota bacterium]
MLSLLNPDSLIILQALFKNKKNNWNKIQILKKETLILAEKIKRTGLYNYLKQEKIKIIEKEGGIYSNLIIGASCDLIKKEIYLFLDSLNLLKKKIDFLNFQELKELFIAHEAFHFLKKNKSNFYDEIGAHLFSQNILKLDFYPGILDLIYILN